MPPKKREEDVDRLTRIAIVNKDKCKPKKCRQVRVWGFVGGGWGCVVLAGKSASVDGLVGWLID